MEQKIKEYPAHFIKGITKEEKKQLCAEYKRFEEDVKEFTKAIDTILGDKKGSVDYNKLFKDYYSKGWCQVDEHTIFHRYIPELQEEKIMAATKSDKVDIDLIEGRIVGKNKHPISLDDKQIEKLKVEKLKENK